MRLRFVGVLPSVNISFAASSTVNNAASLIDKWPRQGRVTRVVSYAQKFHADKNGDNENKKG